MAEIKQVMLDATIDSLRRHAPFDRMDRASLAFLVSKLKVAYFAKGRKVTGPEYGAARTLYIVQRGLVRAERSADSLPGQETVEYYIGECFPLTAVYGKRIPNSNYTALEDTFCYEAATEIVEELAKRSAPFREFCDSRASALLHQAYALLQTRHAQQSAGQQPMTMSLRVLVRRAPISCSASDSLQSALQKMQKAKVGSIVVVGEENAPQGIFTERDLLRHAVAGRLDLNKPIEAFMTPSPRCLPATAGAWEAALLMARMSIRHVVVVEEGRLVGVVSERDLFSLQRMSMRNIIHAIETAGSAESLTQVAADVRKLEGNMVAHGVGAEQLTQLIATLNDRLSCRIIELEARRHDLDGSEFCWMALGSEGRLEQTLSTDQDNGIVFAAGLPVEEMRRKLLPFARSVNELLDACGFPLCKGNIMASNPEWCLSIGEWEQKFRHWISNPQPEALLHSTIFYDFRPLWGREDLAHQLRTWLRQHAKDDLRFLRAMAETALQSRPPQGFFTGFLASAGRGEPNGIDLKAHGTRPFTDAARIYALASGLEHTNTAARLRLSGERMNVPGEEIEAMVEAFYFLLLFRLRHQFSGEHSGAEANRINLHELNELDRRILKESFRQARKLQSRLALDYSL
jgi:CBS domain-containing protein